MNAFAFAAPTVSPYMTVAATTFGVAIPPLIYNLTPVGAAMYVDCDARA